MPDSETDTDVLIAGGGPVGLYLAGRLLQNNISVKVLEQKEKIPPHSKSLGIHPVSMELFDEAGIADRFLSRGIKIEAGTAFIDDNRIGDLSFRKAPEPFNFILALPQNQTEEILEEWVNSMDSNALIRGATVTGVNQSEKKAYANWEKNRNSYTTGCKFLAGCDGKNSFIRKQTGVQIKVLDYPDTYIMGDFSDNTPFGTNAVIYLHRSGLIESFPLPGSYRRWVVKTDQYIKTPGSGLLADLVEKRIRHSLRHQENTMMSSFGVQHQLAAPFFTGRIVLAGDAAHVVSPIGGQGMNLGWINASLLAKALIKATFHPEKMESCFRDYSYTGSQIARKVARRAEMNMWMGRKKKMPFFNLMLVHLMVNTPFSKIAVRRFTMRDLY